jgi:hypothetical protein
VVGVTSSCEATRQRFYRNYAKCGPYVEESRGSAVKVVPDISLGSGDAELLVYWRRLPEGKRFNRRMLFSHPPA